MAVEEVKKYAPGETVRLYTEAEFAAATETIRRLQKVLNDVALGHFALLSWASVVKTRVPDMVPFTLEETTAADLDARDTIRLCYGLRVLSSSVKHIEA